MRRQPTPRGLTLIEVLVAMALLALATLALVSANTFAARASSRSYRRYMAMRLAQQRLDVMTLGGDKSRLMSTAKDQPTPVLDATPQDCQQSGRPADLCSSGDLMGWVDIYGRPCRKSGTVASGYHPTCQYRRRLRFVRDFDTGAKSDIWRIYIAVSFEPEKGDCGNFNEGDKQCIVTSAILTR